MDWLWIRLPIIPLSEENMLGAGLLNLFSTDESGETNCTLLSGDWSDISHVTSI